MKDNLKDFMIVNLAENRSLNLENWTHKLRLTWDSLYCSKETFLPFTCIWVSTSSFCFQSYFRRPFYGVSPFLMYGEGELFSKKYFSRETKFEGKIYKGIVLHGGTNEKVISRGKELRKMHFQVIWTP